MHLFNLHSFGDRFGIDLSVADFNSAVTEASRAATNAVASSFRFREFAAYTGRKDTFRVGRMFGSGSNQYQTFILSRGFINPNSNFTARYSSNPLHIRNNDAFLYTDLQSVNDDNESDYLVIDADQGVLSVFGLDLTDQWVVVNYEGGLDANTDDEFEDVPGWLADAAEAQTILFLKQNNAFTTENETDLSSIRQNLLQLQSAHARAYPGAIHPTMSEPGR